MKRILFVYFLMLFSIGAAMGKTVIRYTAESEITPSVPVADLKSYNSAESSYNSSTHLGVIVFEKDMETIDGYYFINWTSLTSITLPACITDYKKAFWGCSNLTTVYIEATTPPALDNDCFYGTSSRLTIVVPAGTLATYMSNPSWRSYHIVEPTITLTLASSNATAGSAYGAGSYAFDSVASIYAIPTDGYKFAGWSDGSKQNPRILTMHDNISLTANFEAEDTLLAPTTPGMRLRVKTKKGKTYEFQTTNLEKVDYYRAR